MIEIILTNPKIPELNEKKIILSNYLSTHDLNTDLLKVEKDAVIDWVLSRVPKGELLSGASYKIVDDDETLFTNDTSIVLPASVPLSFLNFQFSDLDRCFIPAAPYSA